MRTLRVVIAAIWLLSFVASRAWWASGPPFWNAATSAEITAQAYTGPGTVAGASLVESGDSAAEEPRVDLFGNEIEEAIADYRIDLRGSVYERHSPETEVAKLGSPVT